LAAPLPARDVGRYASFTERSQIKVGKSYLYDTFFLPGEAKLVVSSGQDKSFRVYDARSKKLEGTVAIPGAEDFSAHILPWPKDATSLLVGSTSGLYRLEVASGEIVKQLGDLAVHQLACSPDQKILVMGHSELPEQRSKLRFYGRRETDGGRGEAALLGELDFDERVDGLALSGDNRLLAVTQYPSDTLRVYDLKSGLRLFALASPKYAASVAFSPDGRFVAVGGAGLLVIDLLNSARRAFYGHVGNNIGHVRFSPSGDALWTSSYDGRLRAFQLEEREATPETGGRATLKLSLLKELRHAGTANVYGFDFEADGNGVISGSGDQTVRWFRGAAKTTPVAGAERHFQSLDAWQKAEPQLAQPWPERQVANAEPFRIESISSVQKARLTPGSYSCKISAAYKFRDCTVTKNAVGQTILSFGSENLLPLEAIVSGEGDVLSLVGQLREPSMLYDCKGCDRQPILGVLQGGPRRYEGVIRLRPYYDPYSPPEAPAIASETDDTIDSYPIVLEMRGAATP